MSSIAVVINQDNVVVNGIPQFNIGDEVYHVSNGTLAGKVLDIRFCFKDGFYEYLATFGVDVTNWYRDDQLLVTPNVMSFE